MHRGLLDGRKHEVLVTRLIHNSQFVALISVKIRRQGSLAMAECFPCRCDIGLVVIGTVIARNHVVAGLLL
jgi:hypothetical protein